MRDCVPGRHALQHCVDRGNHDRRLACAARQCRQGRQPAAFDIRLGRHAVVWKAVPGRKRQHSKTWRKEADGLSRGIGLHVIHGHEQHRRTAAARGFSCHIGVIALRHTRDGQPALLFGDVVETIQSAVPARRLLPAYRFQSGKHRVVKLRRHWRGAAQPGVDLLVGRGQQCLELVETGLVQARQLGFGIGAKDQVDFLEAASLRPKQKPFPAVLRRATLFKVRHGADIARRSVENNRLEQ